ncbi:MAG TPA: hypothetical protein VIA80_05120 [Hyphomonadaceae bacterium]
MFAWKRLAVASCFSATAFALFTAGSVFAQTPAPTSRDLAIRFVHDPTNATMLDDTREQMLAAVMEKGKNLPPSVKSWMTIALPAAAEQVVKDLTPVIEQKLVDAYAEKFTVEELQQILDFQTFVRQPHIAKVYFDASTAPTAVAKMEVLKSKLTAAEYERISTETLKHPMLTMTLTTLKLSEEIAGEFVKRFNIVVRQHCATAPQGFPLCEDQGRAL